MRRKSSSRPSSTPRRRPRSLSPQSEDDITLRTDQPTPTPARHRNVRPRQQVVDDEFAATEQEEEDLHQSEEPQTPSRRAKRNGQSYSATSPVPIKSVEANGYHSPEDATRDDVEDELASPTKAYSHRKNNTIATTVDEVSDASQVVPEKRKRGRPRKVQSVGTAVNHTSIRPSPKNVAPLVQLSTPSKPTTPSRPRNVDRSARRKSARAIIQQTIDDDLSPDEDNVFAQHIYDLEDQSDQDEDGTSDVELDQGVVNTHSKKVQGGRSKSSRSTRSKSARSTAVPLEDLAPHEVYFAQNKSSDWKTSNNTLTSISLLTHEEYFELSRAYVNPHAQDIAFLHELHSRSFSQWGFELDQQFSILLYGYGSKRNLLTSFATYLHGLPTFDVSTHRIVICNGYLSNTTIRDLATTIARALSPNPVKLGAQTQEILRSLFALFAEHPAIEVTLIINSIDAASFRRPGAQSFLATLSQHERIHFIASADHPNFTLLWDSSLRSMYNFVFHDCTTFRPYSAEIDVVDEVHALLGRSGRRVGGKEGVAFVLKSLSARSRELFSVLINEQLNGMDENVEVVEPVRDWDEEDELLRPSHKRKAGVKEVGVEYNVLRQKVLDDFICPDEMMLRTILKEFYDHQMITSKKDAMGTETLSVPFGKEELEAILEDLVS